MKNLLELSIISGKNNIWGNHMVSPLFFYKGSENNKMAQVAFVKSYRTLPFDKEEDYGFYDIVYVRSSTESYNKKIKNYESVNISPTFSSVCFYLYLLLFWIKN